MHFLWLLRMAWRDSRRSRARLLLFISSIILGVAALTAIEGFDANLRRDMEGQARSLLGADLVLESGQPYSPEALQLIDSLSDGADRADERSFASMVRFVKGGGTRLVQVRALSGDFPYYGELQTEPAGGGQTFQQQGLALVDHTLMLQFGAEVGDSIQVGEVVFAIGGRLRRVPGQNQFVSGVAAPVFIPLDHLAATGLEQKGSRITYKRYLHYDQPPDLDAAMERLRPRLRDLRLRYDTVETRKEGLGSAFGDLTSFLNLVGFASLLLGCIGVAGAVYVYVQEKIGSIAILRCLGLRAGQAMRIYLLQIMAMGLTGSLIGVVLGAALQTLLPRLLADFLPVSIHFTLSWTAIAEGLAVGTLVALLFALPPLLRVRQVSPLYVFRASYETTPPRRDWLQWLAAALIGLFILGFAYRQIGAWIETLIFVGGLGAAFLILAGLARLLAWVARRFLPDRASYLLRQALANLYRPHNQTLTLTVAIGLGTALISILFLLQQLLLDRLVLSAGKDMPNMVLFDVQVRERAEVRDLLSQHDLPVLQEVPVVTMQLEMLKGRSRYDLLRDTTGEVPRWALNREYRVTYRDSLIGSEELVAGTWTGRVPRGEVLVPISLEENYARDDLGVGLGDELVFNVQGVPMRTVVASLRKVDFARVQTNFLVLFPAGVLEEAPQFLVFMTRVTDAAVSAVFQRELIAAFPTVSVIDLDLILRTAEDLLRKVSFMIRFMALLSILTGLLVLAASVAVSRYQRMRERALLRTLGASRRQVMLIDAMEYLLLGMLGATAGIGLSLPATWALAYFSFDLFFVPRALPLLGLLLGIAALTLLIGILASRRDLGRSPLEVLREEAG
ncbi:MAG: ABC transporter permease [Bacteroidia bacterium]